MYLKANILNSDANISSLFISLLNVDYLADTNMCNHCRMMIVKIHLSFRYPIDFENAIFLILKGREKKKENICLFC